MGKKVAGTGTLTAPGAAEATARTKVAAKEQNKGASASAPATGQQHKGGKERESETEANGQTRGRRDADCEKRAGGGAAEETHRAKTKAGDQELAPTPTPTSQTAAPGATEVPARVAVASTPAGGSSLDSQTKGAGVVKDGGMKGGGMGLSAVLQAAAVAFPAAAAAQSHQHLPPAAPPVLTGTAHAAEAADPGRAHVVGDKAALQPRASSPNHSLCAGAPAPTPAPASKAVVAAVGPAVGGTHAATGLSTSPPPPRAPPLPPPPLPASAGAGPCVKPNSADAAALAGDGASRKVTSGDHQSAAKTLAALASLTHQREAESAAKHGAHHGAKHSAPIPTHPSDAPAPVARSNGAAGKAGSRAPEAVEGGTGLKCRQEGETSRGSGSQARSQDALSARPGGEHEEHDARERGGVKHEYEYVGVEKVPGESKEYSCHLNTTLRFASAEEAAWGHDVLCIRYGHNAAQLNFAEYSHVIGNVLNVVKEIQEKT